MNLQPKDILLIEFATLTFNKLDRRYITKNGKPAVKSRYYLKKTQAKAIYKHERLGTQNKMSHRFIYQRMNLISQASALEQQYGMSKSETICDFVRYGGYLGDNIKSSMHPVQVDTLMQISMPEHQFKNYPSNVTVQCMCTLNIA
ncbi:MAG: hypothetical protein EZS28_002630 [Streblomastix strix]|uniref:Uncharacterized protein n=1 Tax=Streblomastix strix TaxID=222440 RepID=A0A5J4X3E3_9EUKA|nr:MAG: hypothetical protein EZS28_002630 [Streblomastix strix]